MTVPHLPWTYLLPADASLEFRRAPAWSDTSAAAANGGDVLVAWDARPADLDDAARRTGLVLFDPRGIRERDLGELGFGHVRRFAMLPSLRLARWFIPLDGAPVALGALRALCTPYRAVGRLLAAGARAVARAGLPFSRHQVWIARRDPPALELLLRAIAGGDGAMRLGIVSGGWGLRLTPAVAALDGRGRSLAFAKLAGSERSGRLIRHEAEVLPRLAALAGERPLAPRLLFSGELDGTFLLVQSPLDGWMVPPALSPAHAAFLAALVRERPRPAESSGYIRSILERIAVLRSMRPDLYDLVQRSMRSLEGVALPVTVIHGDFAPFNLRLADGRLTAFDWENAELDGLPLVDLVHHELQVGFLLRDWTVGRAFDRLRSLAAEASSTMAPANAYAIEAAYLADMYLRRVDGGNAETSSRTANYYHLLRLVDRARSEHER